MTQTPESRDALLSAARAAHRDAERERARARKLAARLSRKLQHTFDAERAKLDAERAAFELRVAKFNAVQSRFNAEAAEVAERQRAAWADFAARRKRLDAEHEEANRYHTEQSAALDARAAALATHEKAAADAKAKLTRAVAALREEVATLDARARNARATIEELERQRAERRASALGPTATEEAPGEPRVALDRAADRDLNQWSAELTEREQRLHLERAALQSLCDALSADKDSLADRRRVLAEQFAQLAAARAQWQEAERVTLAEMEQLAHTLRLREAELDARAARLSRADARRREDAYELWQLRLRLEAWQSKLVAYEMRWHTEREHMEADLARRAEAVLRREAALPHAANAIPVALPVPDEDGPAVPAELTALRDELERMATVLLEAELPEPPDPPDSELPWGTEPAPAEEASADSAVLLFESRAA